MQYAAATQYDWDAWKLHDVLFAETSAAVKINVSGLAQTNRNRPLAPYVQMLHQVLDAVSALPYRKFRKLD